MISHLPPADDSEEPQYLEGGSTKSTSCTGMSQVPQGTAPERNAASAGLNLRKGGGTRSTEHTEYNFSGSEKEFRDNVKSSGAAACSPLSLFPDRALQEAAALLCQGEVAAGTWPAAAAAKDKICSRTELHPWLGQ